MSSIYDQNAANKNGIPWYVAQRAFERKAYREGMAEPHDFESFQIRKETLQHFFEELTIAKLYVAALAEVEQAKAKGFSGYSAIDDLLAVTYQASSGRDDVELPLNAMRAAIVALAPFKVEGLRGEDVQCLYDRASSFNSTRESIQWQMKHGGT